MLLWEGVDAESPRMEIARVTLDGALWTSVLDLSVERSEQTCQPVGDLRIRFVADDFTSRLTLDDEGFVLDYPGLARRVTQKQPELSLHPRRARAGDGSEDRP
jgi:hypothetical protein